MGEHVRLNELFHGLGKTGGDQSGTGYDFAFSKECSWLGAPADKICDALAVRIAKRGKRKGSNYILRTVARAVAVMEQRKNEPIDITPSTDIQGDANVVLELDRFPENHRDPSKRNRPRQTSMNLYRILTLDPIFAELRSIQRVQKSNRNRFQRHRHSTRNIPENRRCSFEIVTSQRRAQLWTGIQKGHHERRNPVRRP